MRVRVRAPPSAPSRRHPEPGRVARHIPLRASRIGIDIVERFPTYATPALLTVAAAASRPGRMLSSTCGGQPIPPNPAAYRALFGQISETVDRHRSRASSQGSAGIGAGIRPPLHSNRKVRPVAASWQTGIGRLDLFDGHNPHLSVRHRQRSARVSRAFAKARSLARKAASMCGTSSASRSVCS